MTEGLSRTPGMPYPIKEQPTLTFVARQKGEAWNRPFVAVYEPSSVNEPELIRSVSFPSVSADQPGSHVGIQVEMKDGSRDLILSSDQATHTCFVGEMQVNASYALWRNGKAGDSLFFMGNGTRIQTPALRLQADSPISILLEHREDGWHYETSGTCQLTLNGRTYKLKAGKGKVK